MSCYNEGQLQEYLDGAVSFQEQKNMAEHLESCDLCRLALFSLKENMDFTTDSIGLWGNEVVDLKVSVKTGWSKFNLANSLRLDSTNKTKGGFALSATMKRWAVAAAAVLFIGLSLTNSSVRTAAAEFLTMFRVEKIQTISIDPEELRNMSRVFKDKGISLKVDNFGKITNKGVEPPQETALEQAVKLADFEVRTPGYLPLKYTQVRSEFTKAGSVELQLNVNNVNNLIKSMGGTTYLPKELDNQNFYLKTPNVVSTQYTTKDLNGKVSNRLSVTQFRSPEIYAPAGVDVEQMRQAVLSLPVIPEDIKKQLASIEDWQKTMVVPTVAGQTKKVAIGESEALYTVPQTGNRWSQYSILTWESKGIINIVEGNLAESELVKVAESLK